MQTFKLVLIAREESNYWSDCV